VPCVAASGIQYAPGLGLGLRLPIYSMLHDYRTILRAAHITTGWIKTRQKSDCRIKATVNGLYEMAGGIGRPGRILFGVLF
jgi:hypothetical protein